MTGKGVRPSALEPEEIPEPRSHSPQRIAVARGGMVSTAHSGATAAGVAALAEGGNAFDAAAAAAFALGVCEHAASGLGGQTMVLFHHAGSGRTVALDGSSRAPHRAAPGSLKGKRLRQGRTASTVPSTPAVLGYFVERHGRLPLAKVLEPAVTLAREGYRVSALQQALARREREALREGERLRSSSRRGCAPGPRGAFCTSRLSPRHWSVWPGAA